MKELTREEIEKLHKIFTEHTHIFKRLDGKDCVGGADEVIDRFWEVFEKINKVEY